MNSCEKCKCNKNDINCIKLNSSEKADMLKFISNFDCSNNLIFYSDNLQIILGSSDKILPLWVYLTSRLYYSNAASCINQKFMKDFMEDFLKGAFE